MLALLYGEAVSRSTKMVGDRNRTPCLGSNPEQCNLTQGAPLFSREPLQQAVSVCLCQHQSVLVVCDHSDGSTCCQASAPASIFLSDTVVGTAYFMNSLCWRDKCLTQRWKIHVFGDVTLCRGYVSGVTKDCTVCIFVIALSKKKYFFTKISVESSIA